MHRDPNHSAFQLDRKEADTRRILWWWIIQADQQYSQAMNYPLAVTVLGDCPTPGRYCQDTLSQSLWDFLSDFTVVAREAHSERQATNVAQMSGRIFQLQSCLPEPLKFNAAWLENGANKPSWPLDTHAAYLHQRTHSFLVSLNRRLIKDNTSGQDLVANEVIDPGTCQHLMIQSCRQVLYAFQYFRCRPSYGIACWATCQQAFHAANLLLTTTSFDMQDYDLVYHARQILLQIDQLRIHTLARRWADKLGRLLNKTHKPSQSQYLLNDSTLVGGHQTPGIAQNSPDGDDRKGKLTEPSLYSGASRQEVMVETVQEINHHSRNNHQSRSDSTLEPGHPPEQNGLDGLSDRRPEPPRGSQATRCTDHFDARGLVLNNAQQDAASNVDSCVSEIVPLASIRQPIGAPAPMNYDLSDDLTGEAALEICEPSTGAYLQHDSVTTSTTWAEFEAPTAAMPIANTVYLEAAMPAAPVDHDSASISPSHSHSYASSNYTHSNASSLQTPSASHPVSPVSSQRQISQVYCVSDTTPKATSPVVNLGSGSVDGLTDAMGQGLQALAYQDIQANASKISWSHESSGYVHA